MAGELNPRGWLEGIRCGRHPENNGLTAVDSTLGTLTIVPENSIEVIIPCSHQWGKIMAMQNQRVCSGVTMVGLTRKTVSTAASLAKPGGKNQEGDMSFYF